MKKTFCDMCEREIVAGNAVSPGFGVEKKDKRLFFDIRLDLGMVMTSENPEGRGQARLPILSEAEIDAAMKRVRAGIYANAGRLVAASPTKWEYRFAMNRGPGDLAKFNELGREGWELFEIERDMLVTTYIMKRPLAEDAS